ncbi:class III signal peptide-containing protein [Methanobacterium movens]
MCQKCSNLNEFVENNMLIDEKAQISAEMVLLIGAILVIVLVAGSYVFDISQSVAGNISSVIDTARNSTINKM